ncbi:hypothetical protein Thi970DRAFT_04139 [Thiorhodovibrio frisius]|uniref:Transposase (putative) YhgA-like domain-containing protein n=2 Tax=Thiorhodovibrio frisius TaxID=631362 RepID=H8Z594_9GAMM|nr:hypothetical protein Thi970DRAFT_04139 [Thiorhodovibrio frisius]WPL21242.1 PD-(D/E)XK nuclease family transposase [Thiorhodovibrio frisius]
MINQSAMPTLLDPTNDYVFKRLFVEAPDLLVVLINDLRPDPPKADRLGHPPGPLRAWITFFKHWQEELTMATVAHEPVKQAMSRIRELSADEEARRLAFVRERALHDEVSFVNEAKREGVEQGLEQGLRNGREEVARNLMTMKLLTDEQIAAASGLAQDEVKALRDANKPQA